MPNEIFNIENLYYQIINHFENGFTRPNRHPIGDFSTGFYELDDVVSFQRGDLITIGGRPSMGKTIFSMNICENILTKQKGSVLIFNMGMHIKDIALRFLASLTRVNFFKLKSCHFGDHEIWERIKVVVDMMEEWNLFIVDRPCLTPQQIYATALETIENQKKPLDLIVVDYIQLMNVETGSQHTRATQLSEITRSLKALAKDLNVCVIAISQLNRDTEYRAYHRPVITDLADSGSIEADSDTVIFVYRDEVYNDNSSDKGTAEIIVAKQRNGYIGKIRLAFFIDYVSFENLAREDNDINSDEIVALKQTLTP